MAGVPIKFRCYQCNQLIGVSRSKVGKVIACPRCGADLIVPEPDEMNSPAPNPTAAGRSTEWMPADVATGDESGGIDLPIELADIRPEDIRAEFAGTPFAGGREPEPPPAPAAIPQPLAPAARRAPGGTTPVDMPPPAATEAAPRSVGPAPDHRPGTRLHSGAG